MSEQPEMKFENKELPTRRKCPHCNEIKTFEGICCYLCGFKRFYKSLDEQTKKNPQEPAYLMGIWV